jgi:hypothetical protein
MRIPDWLVKCVGFISHNREKLEYKGTVFGVGIPHNGTTTRGLIHLVTAKHVAERMGTDFIIGFNGKDGLPLYLRSNEEVNWFYHPTEPDAVDVAVMPFTPGKGDLYDFMGVPVDSFATTERIAEFSIGLGDEITNIGLFAPFPGKTHFIPIIRTGNVAMMPEDPVPTQIGEIEAYLVEGRSMGGLSGSPVFCRSTVHVPVSTDRGKQGIVSGLGEFHFLGLMHGHFHKEFFPEPHTQEFVNMGVAIVIPAKKILEVLYHPELVKMREDAINRINESDLPTNDHC